MSEALGDHQGHPLSLALQEGVGCHGSPHADPLDAAGVQQLVGREGCSQLLWWYGKLDDGNCNVLVRLMGYRVVETGV